MAGPIEARGAGKRGSSANGSAGKGVRAANRGARRGDGRRGGQSGGQVRAPRGRVMAFPPAAASSSSSPFFGGRCGLLASPLPSPARS